MRLQKKKKNNGILFSFLKIKEVKFPLACQSILIYKIQLICTFDKSVFNTHTKETKFFDKVLLKILFKLYN